MIKNQKSGGQKVKVGINIGVDRFVNGVTKSFAAVRVGGFVLTLTSILLQLPFLVMDALLIPDLAHAVVLHLPSVLDVLLCLFSSF